MAHPWENLTAQKRTNHWGNLTLLEEFREELWITRPDKTRYLADTQGGPKMLRLKCDCGHEFTVKKSEFPGRRLARNCNRPECPYTKPEMQQRARKGHSRGAAITIYIPVEAASQFREYGEKRNLSFSKAILELANEGLVAKLVNED